MHLLDNLSLFEYLILKVSVVCSGRMRYSDSVSSRFAAQVSFAVLGSVCERAAVWLQAMKALREMKAGLVEGNPLRLGLLNGLF